MRCEEIVLTFMRKANKTHLNSILKVLRKSDTIKSVSMALRMNKKKLHLQTSSLTSPLFTHILFLFRQRFCGADGSRLLVVLLLKVHRILRHGEYAKDLLFAQRQQKKLPIRRSSLCYVKRRVKCRHCMSSITALCRCRVRFFGNPYAQQPLTHPQQFGSA